MDGKRVPAAGGAGFIGPNLVNFIAAVFHIAALSSYAMRGSTGWDPKSPSRKTSNGSAPSTSCLNVQYT